MFERFTPYLPEIVGVCLLAAGAGWVPHCGLLDETDLQKRIRQQVQQRQPVAKAESPRMIEATLDGQQLSQSGP